MPIEATHWFYNRRKECREEDFRGSTVVLPGETETLSFFPGIEIKIECDPTDSVGRLTCKDWGKIEIEVDSGRPGPEDGPDEIQREIKEQEIMYRTETWYLACGPRSVEIEFMYDGDEDGEVGGLPEEYLVN
jgi:hypothetical protein